MRTVVEQQKYQYPEPGPTSPLNSHWSTDCISEVGLARKDTPCSSFLGGRTARSEIDLTVVRDGSELPNATIVRIVDCCFWFVWGATCHEESDERPDGAASIAVGQCESLDPAETCLLELGDDAVEMPDEVITSSPTSVAETNACWSFTRFCCGRRRKKYISPTIASGSRRATGRSRVFGDGALARLVRDPPPITSPALIRQPRWCGRLLGRLQTCRRRSRCASGPRIGGATPRCGG